MRIADHIAEYMREHDIHCLMWGDGSLVNAAREHISGRSGSHPLNVMTAACNAMERAPDLFRKTRIHGCDANGNARVVRGFWLREFDKTVDD
ncbi:MAG: hypothetical protein AAF066_11210 [Pseudomonadota bacterium]